MVADTVSCKDYFTVEELPGFLSVWQRAGEGDMHAREGKKRLQEASLSIFWQCLCVILVHFSNQNPLVTPL